MAHARPKSKLQSQSVLTVTTEDGGYIKSGVTVTLILEGVWVWASVGMRSEIDGTINAATVAENKPHYGFIIYITRRCGTVVTNTRAHKDEDLICIFCQNIGSSHVFFLCDP